MLIHAVEDLVPRKCAVLLLSAMIHNVLSEISGKFLGKIPVFFIFRSQKLLRARYWEGR